MRRQGLTAAIKLTVIILIIFTGFLSIAKTWENLKHSDYFIIKDIITNEGNFTDLTYLKGYNIFTLNLHKEAAGLSLHYPNYKKIKFIRILPDRLFVDFVKRKALSYVKLYRYFYVDSDAVLFDVSGQLTKADLPVILGLETKIFGPKAGKKYEIRELKLALNIIKETSSNRAFKNYRIKKIDLANPAFALVFMSFTNSINSGNGDLEVRLSDERLDDELNILSSLLPQVNNERFNIKYIDLRFKEPVIKLKDVEK